MDSAGGRGNEPPRVQSDARAPGRPPRDRPQGAGRPRHASPADPGSYQHAAGDRDPAGGPAPAGPGSPPVGPGSPPRGAVPDGTMAPRGGTGPSPAMPS